PRRDLREERIQPDAEKEAQDRAQSGAQADGDQGMQHAAATSFLPAAGPHPPPVLKIAGRRLRGPAWRGVARGGRSQGKVLQIRRGPSFAARRSLPTALETLLPAANRARNFSSLLRHSEIASHGIRTGFASRKSSPNSVGPDFAVKITSDKKRKE